MLVSAVILAVMLLAGQGPSSAPLTEPWEPQLEIVGQAHPTAAAGIREAAKILRRCEGDFRRPRLREMSAPYLPREVEVRVTPNWDFWTVNPEDYGWTSCQLSDRVMWLSEQWLSIGTDPHLWAHIILHELAHLTGCHQDLTVNEQEALAEQIERACFDHQIFMHE